VVPINVVCLRRPLSDCKLSTIYSRLGLHFKNIKIKEKNYELQNFIQETNKKKNKQKQVMKQN